MQRSARRAKSKVIAMAVTSLAVAISRRCRTNLIGEQRFADDTASSPFLKITIKDTSVASGYLLKVAAASAKGGSHMVRAKREPTFFSFKSR